MSNIDLISLLNDIKFSSEDKMNLLYNIRDILNQSSSHDQAALQLVESIEEFFFTKIEELKEIADNKEQGNFSNNQKMSFRRVT